MRIFQIPFWFPVVLIWTNSPRQHISQPRKFCNTISNFSTLSSFFFSSSISSPVQILSLLFIFCFTKLHPHLSPSSGNPGWPVCVWARRTVGAGFGQGEHQQCDGGSGPGPRGGGHIWAAERLSVRHHWHQWVDAPELEPIHTNHQKTMKTC